MWWAAASLQDAQVWERFSLITREMKREEQTPFQPLSCFVVHTFYLHSKCLTSSSSSVSDYTNFHNFPS